MGCILAERKLPTKGKQQLILFKGMKILMYPTLPSSQWQRKQTPWFTKWGIRSPALLSFYKILPSRDRYHSERKSQRVLSNWWLTHYSCQFWTLSPSSIPHAQLDSLSLLGNDTLSHSDVQMLLSPFVQNECTTRNNHSGLWRFWNPATVFVSSLDNASSDALHVRE